MCSIIDLLSASRSSMYFFFQSERSGRRRPPAERSALYKVKSLKPGVRFRAAGSPIAVPAHFGGLISSDHLLSIPPDSNRGPTVLMRVLHGEVA